MDRREFLMRTRARNVIRAAVVAACAFAGSVALITTASVAHTGEEHGRKSAVPAAAKPSPRANTPGFPNIKGGDFNLIDHRGNPRTSRDPAGRYQLLFFGYAKCQAICTVALPRMAETARLLDQRGVVVTPLLITVDETRDTVDALAKSVGDIHPRLVGLTGDRNALSAAYKAFQIEKTKVFDHPEHGPVYAHGSYIYLLAPDGSFETLLPPVLGPERMADIVTKYVAAATKSK